MGEDRHFNVNLRHSRTASNTMGALCSSKSKISIGLTSVPWLSMRSFSIKCGSGEIGATAIQAASAIKWPAETCRSSSCRGRFHAGCAQASDTAGRFRNLVQQLGAELRLCAPAGRLRDAGGRLHLHGAMVGLAAEWAILRIEGWGGCHVEGNRKRSRRYFKNLPTRPTASAGGMTSIPSLTG